jgi:FtsP/CotA-like multicopper oxidase with cupredoxin domain
VQPELRSSVDGLLVTQFNLAYAPNAIGGQDGGEQPIYTRCYEGMVPGPSLRLRPGDVLNVALENNLPPNNDPQPVNTSLPHLVNSTNFHTHGLHVSPSGNADNVLITLNPGSTHDVDISIPSDHPGGTHWYHPHKHGGVTTQFQGGMGGALIIEGALDAVPEVAAARDIVLVFQELQLNSVGEVEDPDITTPDMDDLFPKDQTLYTVNGQVNPTLTVRPGEVIRLRCLNATIGTFYPLSLDSHDLNLIANDGISLAALETSSGAFLGAGNRLDLLVRAGAAGTHVLRGHTYTRSPKLTRDDVELLTLIVEGEPMDMGLPTTLPAPYAHIEDAELTGSRTIVFDTVANKFDGTFPETFTLTMAFTIDGALFDSSVINQVVNLNAVEEWTLINNADEIHNFHIHTNPFEVISVDGVMQDPPLWGDTILLPVKGSVVIRSRFTDFTGELVLHCHILDHEDTGMMQSVQIV